MANSLRPMMAAGLAALTAKAISGTVSDQLVATGATQGTALALPSNNNIIVTTAAGTGVILPANPQPGDEYVVANLGANSLSVYPAAGGAINNIAANGAFAVGAAKTAKFIARAGSLNWVALLSA